MKEISQNMLWLIIKLMIQEISSWGVQKTTEGVKRKYVCDGAYHGVWHLSKP